MVVTRPLLIDTLLIIRVSQSNALERRVPMLFKLNNLKDQVCLALMVRNNRALEIVVYARLIESAWADHWQLDQTTLLSFLLQDRSLTPLTLLWFFLFHLLHLNCHNLFSQLLYFFLVGLLLLLSILLDLVDQFLLLINYCLELSFPVTTTLLHLLVVDSSCGSVIAAHGRR